MVQWKPIAAPLPTVTDRVVAPGTTVPRSADPSSSTIWWMLGSSFLQTTASPAAACTGLGANALLPTEPTIDTVTAPGGGADGVVGLVTPESALPPQLLTTVPVVNTATNMTANRTIVILQKKFISNDGISSQASCREKLEKLFENCEDPGPRAYRRRKRLRVPFKQRCGSAESILGEVMRQGSLTHAHQLGGVLLDAGGLLERLPNGFALDPLDVLAQLQRGQRAMRRRWRTKD
jgi:hypothetical protein